MAASIVAGRERTMEGKCVVQANNKLIISIILAPDLGANTKADLLPHMRVCVCVCRYRCAGVCVRKALLEWPRRAR